VPWTVFEVRGATKLLGLACTFREPTGRSLGSTPPGASALSAIRCFFQQSTGSRGRGLGKRARQRCDRVSALRKEIVELGSGLLVTTSNMLIHRAPTCQGDGADTYG
jgi:hypothetical protein